MSKLWCIAIALGDPADGMVVVSMQVNAMQEMAVAQAVSDVYRQTGTKLPLMGVNARELTREYLETVLKAMDEAEAKPDPVVRLAAITLKGFVPPPSDMPDRSGNTFLGQLREIRPPDEPA